MTLRETEARQLLALVEAFHSATSLPELHHVLLVGIKRLVSGDCYDLALCHRDSPDTGVFHAKENTYTSDEVAYMLRHAWEHPIARAYGSGATGALALSRFVSDREWRESPLSHEGGYRRLGLRHEIAVDIPGVAGRNLAVFSVVRGRMDFAPRDHALLDLLRPHLGRAWSRIDLRQKEPSPALLRELYPRLSAREAEVLFWIIEGKQNAEIAAILQRRLNTVQEHVENLLLKLRLENRHQLTVAALRACLRPDDR